MTVIKRIKAFGFKSFAKPTEFKFGDDFSGVIGPNGSGKCLIGNSLVQLAEGSLSKIGDLVEKRINEKSKKIDDGFISSGDGTKILSLNLNTLKIEKKPILFYVKRTSPKTLISIRTRSGKKIIATKYHPLFVLDQSKIRSIKAEELKEGTKIAIPNKININTNNLYFEELIDKISSKDKLYVEWKQEYKDILRKIKDCTWKEFSSKLNIPLTIFKGIMDKQNINLAYLIKILKYSGFKNKEIMEKITHVKSKNSSKFCKIPWKNSKEFSRLLGYLLAEGRLSSTSSQVWFTNGTEEIVEDYAELIEKIFGKKPTINEYKPNCYDVLTYGAPIKVLLSKFGMPLGGKTDKKTITNLYLKHSTEEHLSELLNGLYSGDGYLSDRSIEITTKSKSLGFVIETILTRLGINFTSSFLVKIATNSGFSGTYKTIRIYGSDNFIKFKKIVNFTHKEKQEKLELLTEYKKINPNLDLIELTDTVKKISKELNIKIKPTEKKFPRLGSYCYNQCTPSRYGLKLLNKELFQPLVKEQTQSLQLLQKHIESNIYWDEIIEINKIVSKEKWVYDLCIEKNHNFIANNIIVHNSNIIDSLCFVLGRLSAKSLRADKAANLIYNGGKKGNPAKNAEVSIVFDNSKNSFPLKHQEIEVKRTVNQKGLSKYKINGETRTRQQILDLLRSGKVDPNGHNIVLQGDINHVAEMPSEERRKVLENISGISMFEDKKIKALSELEKVDSRLSETEIVMTERDTYLKELKKDRDQALKYKDLEKNINRNKATYINIQLKNKQDKLKELETKILKNQKDIDSIKNNINSFGEEINSKKTLLNELTEKIESKGAGESLTTEIENLKETILKSTTRIDSLKNEIKRIDQRKKQLNSNITDSDNKSQNLLKEKSELQNKITSLEKEKISTLTKLSNFKKSNNLDNIEKELSNLDSQIDQIKNTLTASQEQHRLLLREKDQLSFKLNNIEEIINKAGNKNQLDKLKNFKLNFKTTTETLNKQLDENSSLTQQLSNARTNLFKQQEDHARLKARKASLAETSGANLAIRKIKTSNISGIHGLVSELAEVDKQYTLALEIAAGSRINSIVVENDEVASKCIKYLKDNKLGIATFLPLNKLKSRPIVNTSLGHGLATNLVKFDPKYKDVFNFVFGNTIIVDNIAAARKIGIGKIRMATLEGDLVESSGAMIGGYRSKKFGAFKETGFDDKLNILTTEISRLKNIIDTLDKRKLENENKIDTLRESKANLEASIIKIENSLPNLDIKDLTKERTLLTKELSKINRELSRLSAENSSNDSKLKELSPLRTQISKKIASKQNPQLMKELNDLEKSKDSLVEKEILYNTRIKNIEAQISDILNPEKENTFRIIKEHEKELNLFNQEILELQKSIEENKAILKQRQSKEKKLGSSFKQLFSKRNKLNEEIQKKELKINNEENKIQLFQDRINNYNNEKAKVIAELGTLQQEFEPFKSEQLRKSLTFTQLKDEIYKFERLMKDMGNVNLRSLEIYNEVHKEYSQICNKVTKLKTEKTDVLSMIEEIDAKKTSVFMTTFNEIAKNFEKIFSRLTTKGTAHLILENTETPLSEGIRILVKITTNKYLDIKSLSGGEKTLTALAFIFAIQEYDPASFYVFDEVDAALDKRNSEKLSNLLQDYSKRAQYIVITHNDAIIHSASRLYGVSMRENGISNVVSLKV